MYLTYEKCGDYLIPNLIPAPEPEKTLTKYGLMRRNYLEEHRRGVYSGLLMMGELKASDQMEWVRKMNNIRARAEEIVLKEMVYS